MPETLYMIELPIDPEALIRFAQDQGVNRNRDEDLGYALHTWLKSLLHDMAPKPFRLLQGRRPRLLGYTAYTGETLLEQAETYATPHAAAVTEIHYLANAKAMPATWRNGRALGFEVLLCPTSRLHGSEKDRYHHTKKQLDADHPPPSREEVYRIWLKEQIHEAAQMESARMERFHFVSHYRRGIKVKLERPQALFRGILKLRDSNAFHTLLTRGLGRHRAFGYGMLLLRPS